MGYSVVIKTSKGRFDFQLDKDFATMGRSKDNEIHIDDLSVSRKHAVLEREGNQFYITDLNSSNGTYVNSKKITEKTAVRPEDVIIVGRVHFSFRLDEEEEGTVRMSRDEMASIQGGPNDTNPLGAPPILPDSKPVEEPITQKPATPAPPSAPAPPQNTVPTPPAPPQPSYAPPAAPVTAAPTPPPAPAPRPPQPAYGRATPSPKQNTEYGGFWIRLVAYIIDAFILGIPMVIINTIAMAIILRNVSSMAMYTAASIFLILIFTALSLAYILIGWSKFGTTIGKRIFRLYVVDDQTGRAPTMGKAFLRLVGYIIDGLTFYIGFLMIAFTADKRGLHDMIAKTHVVKR
ncbi:MAG: FHA domain-containing protein [Acidobacteria bacterium]|nr:FHA domain-containing protein [Acidobacteriota bacterium]